MDEAVREEREDVVGNTDERVSQEKAAWWIRWFEFLVRFYNGTVIFIKNLINKWYYRAPFEVAAYFLLFESIFYYYTAMPYDHKSLSGHSTMLMWHFAPYLISALVCTGIIELIFFCLLRPKKLDKTQEE